MGLCKETEGSRVIFQLKHKSHSLEAQDEGLALDPCGSQQIQGELEFPSRTRLGFFPVFPRFFFSLSSVGFQHLESVVDHFQGSLPEQRVRLDNQGIIGYPKFCPEIGVRVTLGYSQIP